MDRDTVILTNSLAAKSAIGMRLRLMRSLKQPLPHYSVNICSTVGRSRLWAETSDFGRVLLSRSVPSPVPFECLVTLARRCKMSIRAIQNAIRTFRLSTRFAAGLVLKTFIRCAPLPKKKHKQAHTRKVIIIGGFGSRDIGDEAMPRTVIENIKQRLPSVDIVMLSPNPPYTSSYHGERAIALPTGLGCSTSSGRRIRITSQVSRTLFILAALLERAGYRMRLWPPAREVLDEMVAADLLFNVGGGNINSIMADSLYTKCTLHLAAKVLSLPVILSGQTIGPLSSRSHRRFARRALNTVSLITLRDDGTSRNRLAHIGVNKPLIEDTADDAMTLPAISRDAAQKILVRSGVSRSNRSEHLLISMNFKGSLMQFKGAGRRSDIGNELEIMAKIADRLVAEHHAEIVFVPTTFSPLSDDRTCHREIRRMMLHRDSTVTIDEEYDANTLKGIVRMTDLAIGMRYHFNVFAASEAVPFLGLSSGTYQATKLQGLASLCNLPVCYVDHDLEFSSFSEVWPCVARFLEERESIRRQLQEAVPTLKRRSLRTIEHAVALLSGREPVRTLRSTRHFAGDRNL